MDKDDVVNDQFTEGPTLDNRAEDIGPLSTCHVTDFTCTRSVAVPATATIGLEVDVLLAGVVTVNAGGVVSLTFTENVTGDAILP